MDLNTTSKALYALEELLKKKNELQQMKSAAEAARSAAENAVKSYKAAEQEYIRKANENLAAIKELPTIYETFKEK